MLKRFAGNEKVATFASAMRSKRSLKRKETGSEKFLKNSCKKIWRKEKLVLPLQPLSPQNESNVLKKSLKNLSKRFGGFKKRFYLCTTFRYEISGQTIEVERPLRIESVLIVIYEQRSLKLLSSKVFIHSKE